MIDTLRRWATQRGYQVGWGLPAAAAAARDAVVSRGRSGELEVTLYRDNLAWFEDGGRIPWDGPATVVVVVMPRPAHTVGFTVGGRIMEAVFPPTYVRYRPLFEEVRQDLQRHGLPGARVEQLDVPLKSLAARLGLVRYGRNNVTYAPGIGSYCQLFGYVTDAALPLPADWQPHEPALLDECADCPICRAMCPAGAIGADRVLLHAERCLTLVNESPGAWPDWIPPSVHHCIVGCLLCQRTCPANPELPFENSGIVFTAAETNALLAGTDEPEGPVGDGIRVKLEQLGQSYRDPSLGRNLRALVEALSPAL